MTTWSEQENSTTSWTIDEIVSYTDYTFDADIAFDAIIPFDGLTEIDDYWSEPTAPSTVWTDPS